MSDPIPPAIGGRGGTSTALFLTLSLVIAFSVAVIATLTVVLQEPDQSSSGHAPVSAAPVTPTRTVNLENDYYEQENRLPAGSVLPLSITEETRNQLAAAARGATDGSGGPERAGRVAGGGTVHVGMIFGATPEDDEFHVVALIDAQYYWTTRGKGPWKYQGVFDARVCSPPVPDKLVRAWGAPGLFGSTAPPGTSSCTTS
ncbi:hypothetical protein OUY22_10025 [Nonomuraea sp. MCN248]|uniref:Uncharacterized protein n=1 Tax=Nonomuraea corallina TaxID=2989783 RepID=A0ABT4S9V4_9ACTN|nr:hypothetical protein [Nonomuraea corallina]MDA0633755.1 hypothetical protein [Nonomuraea corallina]